jgi:predicted mannosyl-3-phosphoglycerate phosphatase (HAD superfamily)
MDVTAICAEAGISRKTGYLWADKQEQQKQEQELTFDLQQEIENLREENKQLKQKYKQERFENEGRKLAWEIHGVDELLAERKKNTAKRHRKQKR